jgi:imidazolonepropionase-like amidohydrolase
MSDDAASPDARALRFLLLAALVAACVAALTAGSSSQQTAAADVLLVRGGTLIDGTGRAPIPNAAVLIERGRITRVGGAGEVTVPPSARVINADQQFIVPGFIDSHVHYRDWLGELFLAHGVTSAFDLGDPTDWILALREAVARDLVRGPRLYVSGNIIDGQSDAPRAGFGGTGGGAAGGLSRQNRTIVRTVEEARRETRALIDRGVDLIKVYQELSPQELAAVTDEAHKAGLMVLGHTYDVDESSQAGLDVVTHLWGVSSTCMTAEQLKQFHSGQIACPYDYLAGPRRDDVVRMLVDRHVYVNPLLANEHAAVSPRTEQFRADVFKLLSDADLRYVPDDPKLGLFVMSTKVRNYATRFGGFPPLSKLPAETQQEFRSGYLRAQEFVRAFAAAGGKLLVGSDTAGASMTPGLTVHHEMQLLVDAGLTPMQAIEAATRIPGELVAHRDAVGTVEPGRRGDLVILAANPLADIANTRRIVSVIKDGVRVDTSYHADYATPLPYPIAEFSSSYVPIPSLGEITPKGAVVRGGPVTLSVRGSGFAMTSVVVAAERPLPTRFKSPSELEATIPADLLQAIATLPIAVSSPRPGGGTSSAFGFVVSPAGTGSGARTTGR